MTEQKSHACGASSTLPPETASIEALVARLTPFPSAAIPEVRHTLPHRLVLRHNAGLLQRIASAALGGDDADICELAQAVRGFLSATKHANAGGPMEHAICAFRSLRLLTELALHRGGYGEMVVLMAA